MVILFSHFPVVSGVFISFGTISISLIPFSVGTRFLALRTIYPVFISFSIMAALVAGVPSPDSFNCSFKSSSSTNLPAFSIAESNPASLYALGGLVFLEFIFTFLAVSS